MNDLKPEDVIFWLEQYPESKVCRDALALLRDQSVELNKKDAEIERLTTELQAMRSAANSLKMHYESARSEAITEFAERLKTFYSHLPGTTVGGAVMFHVDLIAKEMKGATNGSDDVH